MADFTALKTAIQTYIKQNGNEEITGEKLQEILLSVVTTLGDSAINDLITALANEVAARQNAHGTLQQNITNEAAARGNADTALGGRIDDEATARANGDTALSNRLGSSITAENTAADQIGAEAEARAAADTALQGLIDGITDNIENGYVYAGIATPSSTPATGKVFYLALTAGTYTNFGSTEVSQGINILKYNGSAWSLDAFIGIDDTPTPNSPKLVKSGGTFDSIMTDGSAFDISAHFASGGTLATYADLSAALAALNTFSAYYKRGGMSIKYVQSSDNKYVQYFLTKDEWSDNEVDWQKLNLEEEVSQLGQKISNIDFIIPGYVVNNTVGQVITRQQNNSLAYTILQTVEGQVYSVTGTPSSNARLWSTLDADYKVVRCSQYESLNRTEEVTIANGECYIVFNTYLIASVKKIQLVNGNLIDFSTLLNNKIDEEISDRKAFDASIGESFSILTESVATINEEINSQLLYTLQDDGKCFIYSSASKRIEISDSVEYYCLGVRVREGMKFKLNGIGGESSARLWITTDKDMYPIDVANSSAVAVGLEVTIGSGVEYLFVNISKNSSNPYVRQLTDSADLFADILDKQGEDVDIRSQFVDYYAAGVNLFSGDYLDSSSKVWENGIFGADTYDGGSTTTKAMVRPFRLPKGVYQLYMVATTSRYLLYDKEWNLISTDTQSITKLTITDDFAYLVISCLTANVATLGLTSGSPIRKELILSQSDNEYLSLVKQSNDFYANGECLLNNTNIKQNDFVSGYWNPSGSWVSGNASTPLIPIKKGAKVDVFFWATTTPSNVFGVTVLKKGKFIKTYTCDMVNDESQSIMSKTTRVHSTNTLYKAHFPDNIFDSDYMSIQVSGTSTACKMGNVNIFTYGSSLVLKESNIKGLYRFDDFSKQTIFPMSVTGTSGQPAAKYELKVPLSDYFNIRFKFRITDALVNGDYALAPVWAANTSYSIGSYCKYSGVTYICKTAHTSGVSFDSTKWDFAYIRLASVLGSMVNVIPLKLNQITADYTYNGGTYTSYYPSYAGGLKFNIGVNLSNRKFKTYLGDFAMSVRYTGSGVSASIENTGTAMILKVDGSTVATLSYSTYDTMAKLYEAIKAVTSFTVDYGEIVDRTPSELAVFGETQLISTYYGNITGIKPTDDNQVQYTDNPPLFLPYAVASEWVEAEIVGIGDNIYVGVDGITTSYTRKMESVPTLIFGGDCGVLFKDIEIDINTIRDAEIETNYMQTSPIQNILISSANPFTVIFEGHGMDDDIAESATYPGDEMSAPAEWLQRVFNAAFAKGYIPVRLEDIIAHYKIGTPLPKRCFTAIFDDFRFANFLDLKNRSVFTRNGIFASLAVISNQQTTITYNGQTITMEKAVAIGRNAGFECYSHTKDHRYMESEKPSDFISLAQGDIYDGDEKGINPNILIFPYGNNTPYLIDTLRWIGLEGGVTIDVDNPLGNNAWCLVRHEIGVRGGIETILSHIL